MSRNFSRVEADIRSLHTESAPGVQTGLSTSQARGFICGVETSNTFTERLHDCVNHSSISHSWSRETDTQSLFYISTDPEIITAEAADVFVAVRGHAEYSAKALKRDDETPIHFVLEQYLLTNEIPIEHLEGSFSVTVLDGRNGSILVYRNLIGVGNIFYRPSRKGLLIANNLATLIDFTAQRVTPNTKVLPLYFLFRYVPGKETLCEGIFRLMPGECLHSDGSSTNCSLLSTFADYRQPSGSPVDPVEQIDSTIKSIAQGYSHLSNRTGVLLSGGVDSSYLQAHWNRLSKEHEISSRSFCAVVDHAMTRDDALYARTAAEELNTDLTVVRNGADIDKQLLEAISLTGEPPNHVFAIYFPRLAKTMVAAGFDVSVCGEAADGIFGVATANYVQNAEVIRQLMPSRWIRTRLANLLQNGRFSRVGFYLQFANELDNLDWLEHPFNRQATFADWPAVTACFGSTAVSDALRKRRQIVLDYNVGENRIEKLHAANLLTSSMDSASYWATLFNSQGGDLICPFLDSRLLRVAVNIPPGKRFPFRRPKELLKRALARYVPRDLAYRKKLGFGQPIFEWLSEGGPLRPMVDAIGDYDFVAPDVLTEARKHPNWFLYSLLCYDLWYKMFVTRELSRSDMP